MKNKIDLLLTNNAAFHFSGYYDTYKLCAFLLAE